MNIIDAHMHADFDSRWLHSIGHHCGVDFSAEGLLKEMKECSVIHCISMGLRSSYLGMDINAATPYETPQHLRQLNITYIAGINPFMANDQSLEKTRTSILEGHSNGLKIYLGYFPFAPNAPVYRAFYRLAEECNIPVIFHTGDTESPNSKIKFAHPLGIDEIAAEYPLVNFLIAHLGNPWFMDAAKAITKNKNVYADLSGFVAGADNYDYSTRYQLPRIREAVEWIGDASRLLYGSDWPLTPMKEYINFIRTLFPRHNDQEKVFCNNAFQLFKIKPL